MSMRRCGIAKGKGKELQMRRGDECDWRSEKRIRKCEGERNFG